MAGGGEFVEGWLVAQILGEGAYGEVRLLVHARSGAAVALKVVRGGEAGEASEAARAAAREAALHRALRHPHVLRCLGAREHLAHHYMFLEYAQGGELFDKIEPDVGMEAGAARRYWRQTLLGLQYLHERGVAHRDIKPENLLLDRHDNIKISDFGMATLYRHGDRERLVSRVCGTLPYAAPEVLEAARRPYRAPPADVWAAAVVLVAMLAGELPWERAHAADARYAAWAAGGGAGVWRRTRGAGPLLRRALQPAPARRAALPQLLAHAWLAADHQPGGAWRSQPAAAPAEEGAALSADEMDALVWRSQPAQAEDVLAEGDGGAGRGAARLTRAWVVGGLGAAAEALRARGLAVRRAAAALTVEGGAGEAMRATPVRAAAGATLLEFRRWRGCGLRFKRRWPEVRDALAPLAPPHPPPG